MRARRPGAPGAARAAASAGSPNARTALQKGVNTRYGPPACVCTVHGSCSTEAAKLSAPGSAAFRSRSRAIALGS